MIKTISFLFRDYAKLFGKEKQKYFRRKGHTHVVLRSSRRPVFLKSVFLLQMTRPFSRLALRKTQIALQAGSGRFRNRHPRRELQREARAPIDKPRQSKLRMGPQLADGPPAQRPKMKLQAGVAATRVGECFFATSGGSISRQAPPHMGREIVANPDPMRLR